ncbi:4666_t:CDS:2, partial [Entrophospora sp. SA101]
SVLILVSVVEVLRSDKPFPIKFLWTFFLFAFPFITVIVYLKLRYTERREGENREVPQYQAIP